METKIMELEKEIRNIKQQVAQHREYLVALKESIMIVNEEHSKLIGNYMNEMLKLVSGASKPKNQVGVCYDKTFYQEIGGFMVYNHVFVEKIPQEFISKELNGEQLENAFANDFKATGKAVASKLFTKRPS